MADCLRLDRKRLQRREQPLQKLLRTSACLATKGDHRRWRPASAGTTPSQSGETPAYSTSPIVQISPVRVLPQIPPKAPASPLESSELSCTKAEAAKIERFLGISHDAGMGDAIKW